MAASSPNLRPSTASRWSRRHYGDSFEDTILETVLSELGESVALLVSGAQTDACVRSTLHGALVRGYDTTLVSDAHTTEDADGMGRAAAGAGDRAHEPLLEVPDCAWPNRRHRRAAAAVDFGKPANISGNPD